MTMRAQLLASSWSPGAQQAPHLLRRCLTRYVDAEVEHAAHVAQRHARSCASQYLRIRATASATPEAPPRRTPGGPRGSAQVVIR